MTRLLPLTLLLALACSAPAETDPVSFQAAAADVAGTAADLVPEQPAAGGSSMAQGGAAGAPVQTAAGKPTTEPEPTSAAGAGGAPPVEPQPAAGAPTAGTGGQPPTCTPRPWLEACGSRSCGTVDDGCGNAYQCGTCTGLNECTAAGTCTPSCDSLGLECGTAHGLDCGGCDDGLTCDAGLCVEPCHQEPVDTTAGTCALPGQRIWLGCHQAPALNCNEPSPDVWCCPG